MRLDGKVAIVTASTRGIGLACTQRLAREGATVYMAARNMERAENRAKELNDEGCNVKTVYNDATEKETYTSMVEEVFKNEGRIDILVNNFGTSNPQKDLDIKNTEYDEYIVQDGEIVLNMGSHSAIVLKPAEALRLMP